jgi:hypothetical protein
VRRFTHVSRLAIKSPLTAPAAPLLHPPPLVCDTGFVYNSKGVSSGTCNAGSMCDVNTDCFSGVCNTNKVCTLYTTCANAIGGWQTGRFCGGNCTPCEDTLPCLSGTDCTNSICMYPAEAPFVTTSALDKTFGGRCAAASCFDNEKNGAEMDVDCGEAACCSAAQGYTPLTVKTCPFLCGAGKSCSVNTDCQTLICRPHEFEQNTDGTDRYYCATRDLTASLPQYNSRVRGGVRLMGLRSRDLPTSSLFTAVAHMIDTLPSQILVEVIVGETSVLEYGNNSYDLVRNEKRTAGLQWPMMPPHNMTASDLHDSTRVRWVTYVSDFEADLILKRTAQIYTAQLLPGGWTWENAVQARLDNIALDGEYCDWFGRNYTLAAFNVSGIDCSPFLTCSTGTVEGNIDTGAWSTRNSDGTFNSSRFLYNETTGITSYQLCTTAAPSANHTKLSAQSALYRGAPKGSFAALNSLEPTYSADSLRHDLIQWTITRCLPMWRAGEKGSAALTAAEAADPLAAERCPRRILKSGQRTVRPAVRIGVNTTADAGILPHVPRFGFSQVLAACGVPSPYGKSNPQPVTLEPGATFDTNYGIRSRPDPPSDYRVPVALQVVNHILGTPLSPLIVDQPAAQQPVVMLVDRHGRRVELWKGDLVVNVYFDKAIFDSLLFVEGTPLPSPSFEPEVNFYIEPSVVQKRLYPNNVFIELVQRPLSILGTTSAKVAFSGDDLGLAVFTDIAFSRAVKNIALNFTALFITTQLSTRLELRGSTRLFTVASPPPAPLIVATRFMFPFAGVVIIIVICLSVFFAFFCFHLKRMIQDRLSRRADNAPSAPPAPVDLEGDSIVGGADGSVAYVPFPSAQSIFERFFGIERNKKVNVTRPAAEIREEAFSVLRDFVPSRYRFGAIPGAIATMMNSLRASQTDRRGEVEAKPEDVAALATIKLRDTEKHAIARDDMKPVGPSFIAALTNIDNSVSVPIGQKKKKLSKAERAAISASQEVQAKSREEMNEAMRHIIGDVHIVEPEVAAYNERKRLEAEAAAAAARAEKRRFYQRDEDVAADGGSTAGAEPLGGIGAAPIDAATAAATAAAAAGSDDNQPRSSARRYNNSLLSLHARMTPAAPGLDPITKLPKLNRSLKVDDEPPSDAGAQSKNAAAQWEAAARQRALALKQQVATKTRTAALTRTGVGVAAGTAAAPPPPVVVEVVESDELPLPSRNRSLPGSIE